MSGSRLKGRYIDLCTPANTKGILFGISDGEALQEEYFERDQEVSGEYPDRFVPFQWDRILVPQSHF
jgi:hypothetical protein